MGLLAHQKLIVNTINQNFITSIELPRHNGKTYAAMVAAIKAGGETLLVSNGWPSSRAAFEQCEKYDRYNIVCAVHTGNTLVVRRQRGSITFAPYTKQGARGLVMDNVIFDDADAVGEEILAGYAPALLASSKPHIISLSVSADRGLAAYLKGRADTALTWASPIEEEANPALGKFLSAQALDNAKRILPPQVYRCEHLGLSE